MVEEVTSLGYINRVRCTIYWSSYWYICSRSFIQTIIIFRLIPSYLYEYQKVRWDLFIVPFGGGCALNEKIAYHSLHTFHIGIIYVSCVCSSGRKLYLLEQVTYSNMHSSAIGTIIGRRSIGSLFMWRICRATHLGWPRDCLDWRKYEELRELPMAITSIE